MFRISRRTPRSTAPTTTPLVRSDGTLDLTALQAQMQALDSKGKLVFLKPSRKGGFDLKLVDPKSQGAAAKIGRYSQSDVLQPKLEATAREIARSKSGPVQDAALRMFQSQLPKADTHRQQKRSVLAYDDRLESDLDLLDRAQRRAEHKRAPLSRRDALSDLSRSSSGTDSASDATSKAAIAENELKAFADRLHTTLQYGGKDFFLDIVGPLVCNQASLCRGDAANQAKDFGADLEWLLTHTSLQKELSPEVQSELAKLR